MAAGERSVARVATGLALAVLAVGLVWLALRLGGAPGGPVEVPLDAAACARCRMLVSDLSFAGQLHTPEGEVRFFDDPGCLLLHLHDLQARGELDALEPAVARAWVHHLEAERWIPLAEARFVPVPRSPMGYGLGARGPEAAEAPGWRETLETLRPRAGEAGGGTP